MLGNLLWGILVEMTVTPRDTTQDIMRKSIVAFLAFPASLILVMYSIFTLITPLVFANSPGEEELTVAQVGAIVLQVLCSGACVVWFAMMRSNAKPPPPPGVPTTTTASSPLESSSITQGQCTVMMWILTLGFGLMGVITFPEGQHHGFLYALLLLGVALQVQGLATFTGFVFLCTCVTSWNSAVTMTASATTVTPSLLVVPGSWAETAWYQSFVSGILGSVGVAACAYAHHHQIKRTQELELTLLASEQLAAVVLRFQRRYDTAAVSQVLMECSTSAVVDPVLINLLSEMNANLESHRPFLPNYLFQQDDDDELVASQRTQGGVKYPQGAMTYSGEDESEGSLSQLASTIRGSTTGSTNPSFIGRISRFASSSPLGGTQHHQHAKEPNYAPSLDGNNMNMMESIGSFSPPAADGIHPFDFDGTDSCSSVVSSNAGSTIGPSFRRERKSSKPTTVSSGKVTTEGSGGSVSLTSPRHHKKSPGSVMPTGSAHALRMANHLSNGRGPIHQGRVTFAVVDIQSERLLGAANAAVSGGGGGGPSPSAPAGSVLSPVGGGASVVARSTPRGGATSNHHASNASRRASVHLPKTNNDILTLVINMIYKLAKETKASVHSMLGDTVQLTWNATHSIALAETKGALFLSRLAALLSFAPSSNKNSALAHNTHAQKNAGGVGGMEWIDVGATYDCGDADVRGGTHPKVVGGKNSAAIGAVCSGLATVHTITSVTQQQTMVVEALWIPVLEGCFELARRHRTILIDDTTAKAAALEVETFPVEKIRYGGGGNNSVVPPRCNPVQAMPKVLSSPPTQSSNLIANTSAPISLGGRSMIAPPPLPTSSSSNIEGVNTPDSLGLGITSVFHTADLTSGNNKDNDSGVYRRLQLDTRPIGEVEDPHQGDSQRSSPALLQSTPTSPTMNNNINGSSTASAIFDTPGILTPSGHPSQQSFIARETPEQTLSPPRCTFTYHGGNPTAARMAGQRTMVVHQLLGEKQREKDEEWMYQIQEEGGGGLGGVQSHAEAQMEVLTAVEEGRVGDAVRTLDTRVVVPSTVSPTFNATLKRHLHACVTASRPTNNCL